MKLGFTLMVQYIFLVAALCLATNSAIACKVPVSVYGTLDEPWRSESSSLNEKAQKIREDYPYLNHLHPVDARAADLANMLNPVGRIEIKFKRNGEVCADYCTGTLIAPKLVITNHHCIPGKDGREILEAKIRLNYIAETKPNTFLHELSPTPEKGNSDEELDYSVIKIISNEVISSQFVLWKTKYRYAVNSDRLIIPQHPFGLPKRYSSDCAVVPNERKTNDPFSYSCITDEGSSGSLVFSSQDHSIVGLHNASQKGTPFPLIVANSPILKKLFQHKPVASRFDAVGKCIFLGKKSALGSKDVSNNPFKEPFLKELANEILDKTKDYESDGKVHIRSVCPYRGCYSKNGKEKCGMLYGGPASQPFEPPMKLKIIAYDPMSYLNDVFYWGIIDEVHY